MITFYICYFFKRLVPKSSCLLISRQNFRQISRSSDNFYNQKKRDYTNFFVRETSTFQKKEDHHGFFGPYGRRRIGHSRLVSRQ